MRASPFHTHSQQHQHFLQFPVEPGLAGLFSAFLSICFWKRTFLEDMTFLPFIQQRRESTEENSANLTVNFQTDFILL